MPPLKSTKEITGGRWSHVESVCAGSHPLPGSHSGACPHPTGAIQNHKENKMSSYFDERDSIIQGDFSKIEEVEEEVKRDVMLVAGDRETPDQIRGDLMGIIATNEYTSQMYKENPDLPLTPGRINSEISKMSYLLMELHSYFHDIARQRIQTRFGMLSDKPDGILKRRDAWLNNTKS
jgi:hypothetical protein